MTTTDRARTTSTIEQSLDDEKIAEMARRIPGNTAVITQRLREAAMSDWYGDA